MKKNWILLVNDHLYIYKMEITMQNQSLAFNKDNYWTSQLVHRSIGMDS